eukprot:Opistho-2@49498
MASLGWGALPIALCVITGASFITTYAIAVGKGDVKAFFPYISDTGSEPPESCIFSLCLNVSGWIALLVMYLRFKQIDVTAQGLTLAESGLMRRRNRRSLAAGCLSVAGLILVANFQDTAVLEVHMIGAVSVFFFGGVYEILNAQLSRSLGHTVDARAQVISLVLTYIGMAATVAGAGAAYFLKGKDLDTMAEIQKWPSSDRGYAAHVTSTAGEWLMGVSFLAFFLSYVRTFKSISLTVDVSSGCARGNNECTNVAAGDSAFGAVTNAKDGKPRSSSFVVASSGAEPHEGTPLFGR